jgi:hypothetical protein
VPHPGEFADVHVPEIHQSRLANIAVTTATGQQTRLGNIPHGPEYAWANWGGMLQLVHENPEEWNISARGTTAEYWWGLLEENIREWARTQVGRPELGAAGFIAAEPSRPSLVERIVGSVASLIPGVGQALQVAQVAQAVTEPQRPAPVLTGSAALVGPMPNGNGLAANGFPWTTLIGTIGQVAGQVLPAVVGGRRVNGAIGGATPLEPGMIMPTAWTGALMPALGAATGIAVRAGARIAPILARVAGHVGRRVSVRSAVALARRVGPTAAAVALGISADEMLQLITTDATRGRRRRGISARDISRCRSTIRRMRSFMSMLGPMGARRARVVHVPTGFRHRRR